MATATPWSLSDANPASFTVNAGATAGMQSSPHTVWLGDAFAVAWQTGTNGVVIKPYDAAGQFDAGFGSGAPGYVLKADGADIHNLVATNSATLGLVAAWEEGATIKGGYVDSANGNIFSYALAAPPAGSTQLQATIAPYEVLDSGNKTFESGFQLVYTQVDANGGTQLFMQRFMVSGPPPADPLAEHAPTLQGDPKLIAAGGSNASTAALHDGQVAIAYEQGGAYKVQVFKPFTNSAGATSFSPITDPTHDNTQDFVDVLVGSGLNPGSAKLVTLSTGFMAVYAVGDEIHAKSYLGTAGADGWTATQEQVLATTGGLAGFEVAPLDGNGSGVVLTWASGGNLLGQVFGPGGTPAGSAQVFGAGLNATGHFSAIGLDSGLLAVATEVSANGGDIAAQMFDTRAPNALLEGVRTGGQRETLVGTMGNDTLNGLAREDILYGGAGIDTALYGGTRGQYTLTAAGGTVNIIGPDAGSSAAKPETLTGVEFLQFSDGTYKLDSATASLTLVTPQAPQPGTVSIADPIVQVAEGNSGTKTFTFNAIRDPGTTGDITVHWAVELATGSGNATADDFATLSGDVTIAAGSSSAAIQVLVKGDTAVEGNEAFTVRLSNAVLKGAGTPVGIGKATAQGIIVNDDTANHAPTVAAPIADQSAAAGVPWSFAVPAGTFTDADASDTVALTATMATGLPLPSWLRFDAATRTFSGTPPASFIGQIDLKVTADDGHGGIAFDVFKFVTTSSQTDTTPPVLQSASVNGSKLVLTYNEALDGTEAHEPAPGAFAVKVDGTVVNVGFVAVDSANHTVTLTLDSAVQKGETVKVSYIDPSSGNDASAIQDLGLNDAETVTDQAVSNDTPPEPPLATATPWSLSDADLAPFTVNTAATDGTQSSPHTVWLGDAFAVAWQTGTNGVVIKPYDAAGQFDAGFGSGAPGYVLKADGADIHNLVATNSATLGLVAAWEEGATIKGGYVDSANGNIFSYALAAPPAGSTQLQATIAPYEVLDSGNKTFESGFQLVYTQVDANGGTQLFMQRFMVSGPPPADPLAEHAPTLQGDPKLIAAGGSNASTAALHDGQVAIAYEQGGAYKVQVFRQDNSLVTDPTGSTVDTTPNSTVDVLVGSGFTAGSAKLVTLSTGFMAVYAVGDEIHARSYLGAAGADGWTATQEQVLATTGGRAGFEVAPLDGNGSGVVLTWASGGNLLGQVFGPGGTPAGSAQVFGAGLNATGHFSAIGLDSGLLAVATEVSTTGGDIAAQMFDTRAPNALLEGVRTGGQRETLVGTMGNDTLNGLAREDILYGGAGIDTALYGGTRGQYTLTAASGTVNIVGPDAGSSAAKPETLTGVEFLQFSDGTYKLDSANASLTLVTPQAPQPGTVSIADPVLQVAEGNSGTKTFTFNAIRDPGTTGDITVRWDVKLGAAGPKNAAADDFVALTGNVTILAGNDKAPIAVVVRGDTAIEENEAFTVQLSNAALRSTGAPVGIGKATAQGIIVNDDANAPPAPTDTTAPLFKSAAVTGNQLVLTYDEALDTAHPSTASAFAVTAGGTGDNVTAVTVNGSTVVLTLATAVTAGQVVTVSYTDPTSANDTNAIQDAAGNDAVSLASQAVTNNTQAPPPPVGDTTAPLFKSAAVTGNQLSLTYDEALDAAHPPLTSAFSVSANGVADAVTAVAVNGSIVTLTLANAVQSGQAITVSYTNPTAGNDVSAIQDVVGNDAVTLTNQAVTNTTPAGDTTPPVFRSATVDGTKLVLTYSEALDAAHPPLAGAFPVTVGNAADNVTGVVVNGSTVTLTLATAVLAGQTVTFGYKDPTDGNDQSAIQDLAGNDATSLTNQVARNDTADQAPTGVALKTTSFSEAAASGTVIGALSATDPEGGAVRFQLTDDAGGRFKVVKDASGPGYSLAVAENLLIDHQANDATHGYQIKVSALDAGGHATVQTFSLTANGVTENRITGTAADNNLTGATGADYINGGAGRDTMAGGTGNDIYLVDNGGDRVTENANAGTDTIYVTNSSFDLNSASNVENLVFIGTGAFNGKMAGFSGTLIGGGANDQLQGGNGNDLIEGLAGNDTMSGGSGTDTLVGGAGNDILTGGSGIDTFVYRAGAGADVVADFVATGATHDIIEVSLGLLANPQTTAAANFAALRSLMSQPSQDTVITFGTGETLTLQRVAIGSLTFEDFAFV